MGLAGTAGALLAIAPIVAACDAVLMLGGMIGCAATHPYPTGSLPTPVSLDPAVTFRTKGGTELQLEAMAVSRRIGGGESCNVNAVVRLTESGKQHYQKLGAGQIPRNDFHEAVEFALSQAPECEPQLVGFATDMTGFPLAKAPGDPRLLERDANGRWTTVPYPCAGP